jgi:hypothetical protein
MITTTTSSRAKSLLPVARLRGIATVTLSMPVPPFH